MSLIADLANRLPDWTPDAFAPLLFGRLRVSANLRGLPFPARMSRNDITAMLSLLLEDQALVGDLPFHIDLGKPSDLEWELLAERWLLEPFRPSSSEACLRMEDGERLSLLIAGHDHLAFSARGSFPELLEAHHRIEAKLDALGTSPGLALDSEGALQVSSPFLCGHGSLLSLVFHFPGLAWWGRLEETLDPLLEEGVCYRTWQDGFGDFLVLENVDGHQTRGAFLESMMEITARLIQAEDEAREELLTHRRWELEDRLFRALAICRHARMMGYPEMLEHFSFLRLGARLHFDGHLPDWDLPLQSFTSLLLPLAPAHLRSGLHATKDGRQLAHLRAEGLRKASSS